MPEPMRRTLTLVLLCGAFVWRGSATDVPPPLAGGAPCVGDTQVRLVRYTLVRIPFQVHQRSTTALEAAAFPWEVVCRCQISPTARGWYSRHIPRVAEPTSVLPHSSGDE
jgi:hypothetical protein